MTGSHPTEDEVAVRLARRLAAVLDELDLKAHREGFAAVGRDAEPDGTPEKQAAIAAHYERLWHEAGSETAA